MGGVVGGKRVLVVVANEGRFSTPFSLFSPLFIYIYILCCTILFIDRPAAGRKEEEEEKFPSSRRCCTASVAPEKRVVVLTQSI